MHDLRRTAIAACLLAAVALCTYPALLAHWTVDLESFQVPPRNNVPAWAQNAQPAWGSSDAEVFTCYLKVHGTPPTDIALRHYTYIRRKHMLNSKRLQAKMLDDMPTADD